jgi:TonB family protein
MTPAHEWLAREAAWWWPGVADHLWQATLFALIVLTACFALKSGPARVRHSFWLLASAKLILPTTLFVFLLEQTGLDAFRLFSAASRAQQNGLLLEGITTPISMFANNSELTVFARDAIRHNEVYCALTGVWLTGCAALLVAWGWRRRKFLRALKFGKSVRFGREWEALERAQKSLNFRTDVELIISSHKTEPTVCGVLKPVVMLPESIAEHLDDGELEAIMLHELVHILRRDNLIGNLQMVLCAVFWFYPPVWFFSRKIFDEREQACDEKVLEIYGSPEAYAASILKVVRFCFGWNKAGSPGAGSGSNLRRRIENIMSTHNSQRSARAWPSLLAGSLVGLALVLMVAAGVNGRAGNDRSEVTALESERSGEITLADDDSLSSYLEGELGQAKKTRKSRASAPPPPPPPPLQSSMPSQASQPSQPSTPAQPSQPSTPAQPSKASTPSRRKPPPPPPSPAASTIKTQDKSSGTPKDESDQKKNRGEVVKGPLIEAPRPVYPTEARKQRVEGEVSVAIVIGEEGKVISARAKSGPELLQSAAVDAAYKARFKPATLDGKPVKVFGAMSYNFVLDEN